MTDPALTLYGDSNWISPYVFSCVITLTEKKLPYSYVGLNLERGEHRKPELAKKGLTSRVPTLAHGDFWLAESQAIVEYLDEAFPETHLLPEDRKDRARTRQIMAWIRSDLMPIREERSTHTMFLAQATKPLSEAGREAAAKLFSAADGLISAGNPNLFGAFSIADADLSFMLHRLILNGDDVPTKLADYARAHWQRPSIRAFVEHARPSAT
jgi:glutathione S-transferase